MELQINPKFYMLVGISGSGKSFVAEQVKRIYKNHLVNIEVHSSDAIRKELWGDENDQQNPQKVFQILHKRVKNALSEGKDVIYDATNLSRKRRIAFLQELKHIPCYKSCLIVATPFDECVLNDSHRARHVGLPVIAKQREHFQCPYFFEGWDSINIITTANEIDVVGFDKLLNHLVNIPHDNPHHEYTIGKHMCAAKAYCVDKYQLIERLLSKCYTKYPIDEEKVEKLGKELNEWFWAARVALYHDIGKGFTKKFLNFKGERTDIAHYYNHQNVSAYEIVSRLRFAELLKDEAPADYNSEYDSDYYWLMIAVLVNLHMEPFFHPYDSKQWKKLHELIGDYLTNILVKFHEADLNSH